MDPASSTRAHSPAAAASAQERTPCEPVPWLGLTTTGPAIAAAAASASATVGHTAKSGTGTPCRGQAPPRLRLVAAAAMASGSGDGSPRRRPVAAAVRTNRSLLLPIPPSSPSVTAGGQHGVLVRGVDRRYVQVQLGDVRVPRRVAGHQDGPQPVPARGQGEVAPGPGGVALHQDEPRLLMRILPKRSAPVPYGAGSARPRASDSDQAAPSRAYPRQASVSRECAARNDSGPGPPPYSVAADTDAGSRSDAVSVTSVRRPRRAGSGPAGRRGRAGPGRTARSRRRRSAR